MIPPEREDKPMYPPTYPHLYPPENLIFADNMMDEKYQQQEVQGYPLAPATVVPRSDEVSAPPLYPSEPSLPAKKRKRMQCLAIIIAFVVIQSIIILLLLFITRVTTPNVELGDVIISRGDGDSLRLAARVRVENANFGHFDFENAVVTVKSPGNDDISQVSIPGSRVKARSTKKISITADLGSHSGLDSESDADSGSGIVELRVKGKLRGKVEVLNVIKRKKGCELDCKMRINLATKEVRDLRCK